MRYLYPRESVVSRNKTFANVKDVALLSCYIKKVGNPAILRPALLLGDFATGDNQLAWERRFIGSVVKVMSCGRKLPHALKRLAGE